MHPTPDKNSQETFLSKSIQLILDNYPDFYVRIDSRGVILDAKEGAFIKGFIPIPNKRIEECIPILDYQRIKKIYYQHYVKDQVVCFFVEYQNQYLEIIAIPLDGETLFLVKDHTKALYALQENELTDHYYKSLFFNAPHGIARLNSNFIFQQVNPALCRLLGLPSQKIIGRSLLDFLKEDKNEFLIDFVSQFLVNSPLDMDLAFLNAKNETLYINLRITTVSDAIGITQDLLAYFVDITTIRQNQQFMQDALREKESLIKEIQHRVKNNLQVISSLLSLQMSHFRDTEFLHPLKVTQNRVHSIALLHDQLYKSNSLHQVVMQDYIFLLTQNLIHSNNKPKHLVKLDYQIENFVLDIQQASPIAIILNELISNSLKYAVATDEELILSIQHRLENGNHIVTFRDNGSGLPADFDIQKTRTLGLSLVNILTKQINGKLTYTNQQGASFEIVFSVI